MKILKYQHHEVITASSAEQNMQYLITEIKRLEEKVNDAINKLDEILAKMNSSIEDITTTNDESNSFFDEESETSNGFFEKASSHLTEIFKSIVGGLIIIFFQNLYKKYKVSGNPKSSSKYSGPNNSKSSGYGGSKKKSKPSKSGGSIKKPKPSGAINPKVKNAPILVKAGLRGLLNYIGLVVLAIEAMEAGIKSGYVPEAPEGYGDDPYQILPDPAHILDLRFRGISDAYDSRTYNAPRQSVATNLSTDRRNMFHTDNVVIHTQSNDPKAVRREIDSWMQRQCRILVENSDSPFIA